MVARWGHVRKIMPHKCPKAKREYNRKYIARRMKEDPSFKERNLKRIKENSQRYKEGVKSVIARFKLQGCIVCGEKEPYCLDCHHLDPNDKSFAVGAAVGKGISAGRVQKELGKCICICANCHRKLHAGLIQVDKSSSSPASATKTQRVKL